jgi:uncharacterized membrane protein YwzB
MTKFAEKNYFLPYKKNHIKIINFVILLEIVFWTLKTLPTSFLWK